MSVEDTNLNNNDSKFKKRAYVFVILAAVLWGTIGIFVKKLNTYGFTTFQIVFIRSAGACITLIVYYLFKHKKINVINPKDSIYFIGTGIFSFVFFNWCYFVAINKTTLSIAAILLYTAPTIVMVFSILLFKEKMTVRKLVSLILTFIGCVLVTAYSRDSRGQSVTYLGILAGLGSGFGYALYSVFGRYALKKYDSLTVTLYTFIFASIGIIPFINISEMIRLFSGFEVVLYAAILGLFATTFPFLLYTKGLTYLETSKASIIATLEPIVAAIISITVYSEPVTLLKLAGIFIVISAVFNIREKSDEI